MTLLLIKLSFVRLRLRSRRHTNIDPLSDTAFNHTLSLLTKIALLSMEIKYSYALLTKHHLDECNNQTHLSYIAYRKTIEITSPQSSPIFSFSQENRHLHFTSTPHHPHPHPKKMHISSHSTSLQTPNIINQPTPHLMISRHYVIFNVIFWRILEFTASLSMNDYWLLTITFNLDLIELFK